MNTTKQVCFSGLKPTPPTIRTERVARAIATRIVEEVNLDDFYWEQSELPERIEDATREIMRVGKPATVFTRLHQKQPPINDRGERGGVPYGWEGIDEHCRHIGERIACEELEKAIGNYNNHYGA